MPKRAQYISCDLTEFQREQFNWARRQSLTLYLRHYDRLVRHHDRLV